MNKFKDYIVLVHCSTNPLSIFNLNSLNYLYSIIIQTKNYYYTESIQNEIITQNTIKIQTESNQAITIPTDKNLKNGYKKIQQAQTRVERRRERWSDIDIERE
ncbi:hypothetical protein ACKWTF_010597 [Chironomus riparius]